MKTSLPVLRASSMTLAAKCAASIAPADVAIDSFDPTATTGGDIHRAITLALQGKEAAEVSADVEIVSQLAVDWVRNWLLPKYPRHQWRSELSLHATLGGVEIRGTMDNAGVSPMLDEEGVVVDWKATYRDDDHTAQVLTYAWLLLENNPFMPKVTVIVPMLRLGKADPPLVLPRDWVMIWMKEFEHNTLRHPEIFRPGEWCTRCHRKMECPALKQMNQQTAEVLSERGFEKILSRQTLPDLRVRVKLLEDAINCFKAYQREEIIENGPLSLGNGKLLKATQRKLDVIGLQAAWPLLQKEFSDVDMETFIGISKTKMLDVIGKRAPARLEGQAARGIHGRIEEGRRGVGQRRNMRR
jgi:hypothetical protein